jgi:hypothetical protein
MQLQSRTILAAMSLSIGLLSGSASGAAKQSTTPT